MTREQLRARIDTVEGSYEFFLAYAAQGLPSDEVSPSGPQLRESLRRTDEALADIATGFNAIIDAEEPTPIGPYRAMVGVLERDIVAARAAVQLVLAQSSISSQLVDNLNASIHLRAVLTDLFLLDDVLSGLARRQ